MISEMPRLYLETSVISYYSARPSRDVVTLAHQQLTRDWWQTQLPRYEVFVSDLVYLEAEQGDPDAIRRRKETLEDFGILMTNDSIRALAGIYSKRIPLPEKAGADALHLAIASWHSMDYLLTWNCRHIANGYVIRRIAEINMEMAKVSPTICTPEELLYGKQTLD